MFCLDLLDRRALFHGELEQRARVAAGGRATRHGNTTLRISNFALMPNEDLYHSAEYYGKVGGRLPRFSHLADRMSRHAGAGERRHDFRGAIRRCGD